MLKQMMFVARKDVKYMLRSKETLFWIFLMPIVFFYFIGTVTSGFGGKGSSAEYVAVKMGEEPGFLADQLILHLEARDYTVIQPPTEAEFQRYSRRIAVPDRLTERVLAGERVKIRFQQSGSGLGGEYHTIRVGRAVYTLLADVVATGLTQGTPSPEAVKALNEMPRAITMEVTSAGERPRIPTGFEQAVPGIMVMFVLLVMTTSGSILLVIERRQGLLSRLACTPINRTAVVMGKTLGKWVVGVIQIAFAMVVGTLLFGIDWGPDLGTIILVMLVYGALMAVLGVLLGSVTRTEGQAAGIGVIAANVLAALGGCWWPIEITPEWMQKLQLFLPTGWAMDAMHRLVSFQAGPASVTTHLVGMLIGFAVLVILSARVFRYQ